MTETAKAPVRCGLSGTALKYIACITMLIDHIGASCIEAGILLPALAAGAASCGGIPVIRKNWKPLRKTRPGWRRNGFGARCRLCKITKSWRTVLNRVFNCVPF